MAEFAQKKWIETAFLVLVFGLAALFAYYFGLNHLAPRPEYAPAGIIDSLIRGDSVFPAQYRILVPWTVGLLHDSGVLSRWISSPRGYCYVVEILSTFSLFVAMWMYLGFFVKSHGIRALGLLLLMYVLCMDRLVPKGYVFYYPSDMPAVVFFLVGLMLLYKRCLLFYYPLFLAATLNRETSLFLVLAFLFVNWKQAKGATLLHCAVQGAIWFGVKVALSLCYGSGSLFVFQLPRNILAMASPYSAFQALSGLGLTWLIVALGWRRLDNDFLRSACLIVPFYIAVMLCVGIVEELRIYGELIPVLLPPAVLIIRSVFRDESDRSALVSRL